MRLSLCQLLAAITGDSAGCASSAPANADATAQSNSDQQGDLFGNLAHLAQNADATAQSNSDQQGDLFGNPTHLAQNADATAQSNSDQQGDLFGNPAHLAQNESRFSELDKADIAIMAALHASAGMDITVLSPKARRLFELSVDALEAIVHAWMSELPIAAETIRFGQKILAAAKEASRLGNDERQAANTAATDRGDADVQVVQEAAYKVWHEIHRLMGLLRFSPDEEGAYIARCEPDHLALPALGPHFRERFGQTPWAIIDERRNLGMGCSGASIDFFYIEKNHAPPECQSDNEWENMWRHYHKTINNESRHNPGLQRRFMPKRYWKYLTELT